MEWLDQLNKNLHKSSYYIRGVMRSAVPKSYWQKRCSVLMSYYQDMSSDERTKLDERVDYYCKLQQPFSLDNEAETIKSFSSSNKSLAYVIDYRQLLAYFPLCWKTAYWFGDITKIPAYPRFLKSRPIYTGQENANSILLKLNQIRHYYRVKDRQAFSQKIGKILWRGKTNQPERQVFLESFFHDPLFDIGDTSKKSIGSIYAKPFMSIPQQLTYKYLLSIEGYDVATNTKWIMASNSLCFMRKPRYETWFMEGKLIPGYHYVLLKDDYSDIKEKVEFYENNPDKAEQIIHQAHEWVEQFYDDKRELLISLLVMYRYFLLSGQTTQKYN
jgi:Glycosyl transferase family 90